MIRKFPMSIYPRHNISAKLLLFMIIFIFTTVSTPPFSTQSALAQGVMKSRFGEWALVCDTPPGASSEQCALVQNVVAEDRPEMGLSVVVLRTADRKAELLRVLAPLGVLLPNGLGLYIDEKEIGNAFFTRCFNDGCYAEVVLEEKLIKALKSGKTATFIVFQTPEEGIGIPIDLAGFTDGFAKLP